MIKIGILGSGYVGKALALHWKHPSYEVSLTTRDPLKQESLLYYAHDVHDLSQHSLQQFIVEQTILVICLAPNATTDSYQSTYLDTAQFIRQHLTDFPLLRQIIYTGSTSIYGDREGKWVDEATSLLPLNANNQILLETENILASCRSEQVKVCLFRLGEIYGPDRQIEQRLKKMCGKSFPGTGESFTNLIHLDDIVSALDFALVNRLDGVYNLCNDLHIERRVFYQTLCQQECLPPIQWDASLTSSHAGNRKVSNQKLKEQGFQFSHSLYP